MTTQEEEMAEGWQRTHPLAVLVSGIGNLKQAAFPLIAAGIGTQGLGGLGALIFVPIILFFMAVNIGFSWLAWRRLQYRVGGSDIQLEKGILSRQARSVPYERIQDVSLEQSLIPRLFGLVEVRFETGAGGKDELKLAYVSEEEGARLREVVRDQKEGAPAARAADASDNTESQTRPAQGELLFAMPPARLLQFGVFEFSLIVVALLGAAAQYFEAILPFELWDLGAWEERLAGPGQWLSGLGWASRVVGIAAAILFLIVLGFASGIVRTILRDWDFRLERTPKGFRRRRGLLTKTDVVMPVHRVQAVTVSTGFLRRIWGWKGLSFISLAQDAKSANHSVAPFAQDEEIAPIVREAGFSLPGENVRWHQPSPKYRIDMALWSALPIALAGIVMLFFDLVFWLAPLLLLFAGIEALRQYFLWRFERHAVDGAQIMSRRGWLAPRLTMASRIKLHSVEITQGPIAKRRGYANLKFGLAGGTLSFDGLILAEAEDMRAAVLDSIASVDFAHLPR